MTRQTHRFGLYATQWYIIERSGAAMGFWTKILGKQSQLETKSSSVIVSDPSALSILFGDYSSASGKALSPEQSLRCPTVYSAVRCIAESVSQLPIAIYKVDVDGCKTKAVGHPLTPLLCGQVNEWTPSGEFFLGMTAALMLHGNAFAFVNRDGERVVEIIQLSNAAVSVDFDLFTMEPFYRVTDAGGGQTIYSRREILHLRLMGLTNCASGLSPVSMAKEAIQMALSLEEHGVKLFSNGARPSGILEHPGKLMKDMAERVRSAFQSMFGGSNNAAQTPLLEEGLKFVPLAFNSTDAEFLANRRFQVEEIARAFRVPLHKIGSLDKATFSNIEQQSLEFVTDTLMPILKLWKGALRLSLFSPAERDNYCIEFDLDDLLKADTASRFQSYQVAILNGIYSPNEIRAKEAEPPYPGGDQYRLPLNTADASGVGAASGAAPVTDTMTETPAPASTTTCDMGAGQC